MRWRIAYWNLIRSIPGEYFETIITLAENRNCRSISKIPEEIFRYYIYKGIISEVWGFDLDNFSLTEKGRYFHEIVINKKLRKEKHA